MTQLEITDREKMWLLESLEGTLVILKKLRFEMRFEMTKAIHDQNMAEISALIDKVKGLAV